MKLKIWLKDLKYNIKYGIKNIIRWLPVIWKLRDWDFNYIYKLIEKQLSNMEECFINGWGSHSRKEINKIKIVRNLSRRLYEDNYLSNALIPIENKYGESNISFQKTDDGKFYKMVSNDSEEHIKARHKAYKHSDNMKNQDRKMLFTILEKYIELWWD